MAHDTTTADAQAELDWRLDQQARDAWRWTHPTLRLYLVAYDLTPRGQYLAWCRQHGRQP